MTAVRTTVVTALLLLTSAFLASASRSEIVPPRKPLVAFPMQIDGWRGQRVPDLDQQVLAVLGVDDYLTRLYLDQARQPLELYVGYFQSQRQGKSIHSPLNCLPGSGWQPIALGRVQIPVRARQPLFVGEPVPVRTIEVNRYVLRKGLSKAIVLYWYQSQGRVIASEYWGKFYTIGDAIRFNRTDAALVRVVSHVSGEDAASEATADRAGIAFIESIFPRLGDHLPGESQ